MPDNYIDGGWGNAVPGVHDIVADGQITRFVPNKIVFVESSSQVSSLNEELAGTFAATYGFKQMWQYNGNGTWISMTSGSDITVSSV